MQVSRAPKASDGAKQLKLADKLAGKIPQASTNTIVRTVRVEVVDGGNVLPMQVEEKYAQAVVNALRRAKGAMG